MVAVLVIWLTPAATGLITVTAYVAEPLPNPATAPIARVQVLPALLLGVQAHPAAIRIEGGVGRDGFGDDDAGCALAVLIGVDEGVGDCTTGGDGRATIALLDGEIRGIGDGGGVGATVVGGGRISPIIAIVTDGGSVANAWPTEVGIVYRDNEDDETVATTTANRANGDGTDATGVVVGGTGPYRDCWRWG